MSPLYLLDSQLFHSSLLPSIKLKYLRGVIKVPLPFEDFWYLFGINILHDAVAHLHTEPLSFAGELSKQYNSFYDPDNGFLWTGCVTLVISVKRGAAPYAGTCNATCESVANVGGMLLLCNYWLYRHMLMHRLWQYVADERAGGKKKK